MSSHTQTDIGRAGRSFIEGLRASAAGTSGSTPVSGHGSSDGESSGSSSGSSGGGIGNNKPPPNHPKSSWWSSDNMSPQRWVLFMASIIVGLGTVFLILWRTSPGGIAVQKEELALESQKVTLKTEEVRLKQMRIAAKTGQPVITQPFTAVTCIAPAMSETKYSAPIQLVSGQCLDRQKTIALTPADYANFWVVFKTEPKKVEGVADIIEFVPGVDAEGKRIPVERSRCTTSETNDCISYLKSKLNIPLSVFNTTDRLKIHM